MKGSAVFDASGAYRYRLDRWELQDEREPLPQGKHRPRPVNFLMLNPSTADADKSDPTVTRCEGYARRWGFDRLIVTNLFAFRSTNPTILRSLGQAAVGEANDASIVDVATASEFTVCAWGAHPAAVVRGSLMAVELGIHGVDLRVLGLAANGQPRHPLYLRHDLPPVTWAA